MRARGAWALGALRSTETTDELIAALADETENVRKIAARSLREIQPQDLMQKIAPKLTDPRPEVRAAAMTAIATLDQNSTTTAIRAGLQLAQRKRQEALEPLLEALHGEDHWGRAQASDALGALGAKEAVEPLLAAAEREENAAPVISIYRALGALASSEHVGRIEKLLGRHEQPSDAADAILEALWTIADREARRPSRADP
jgi:HEAT repeat protein